MPVVSWDASALAKRYFPERGSETVDALFDNVQARDMLTTAWGYIETYAMLVRRLNGGAIDAASFAVSVAALHSEIVDDPDFGLLPIDDSVVFAGAPLVRLHNLNATDGVLLAALLDYAAGLPPARGHSSSSRPISVSYGLRLQRD